MKRNSGVVRNREKAVTRLTAFLRNVNWGFVAALAFCYGVWYVAVMQLLAYLGGVK